MVLTNRNTTGIDKRISPQKTVAGFDGLQPFFLHFFFLSKLEKKKPTQKGLEKNEGVQGGEEKNLSSKGFFFSPCRPDQSCFSLSAAGICLSTMAQTQESLHTFTPVSIMSMMV